MEMTDALKQFVREHANEDTAALLLKSGRYPGIDVPFAATQIQARRQIRTKLPSWYACDALVFPSKVAAEQCSSELTARYKQRFVRDTDVVCDLTGGLGVDAYFFSRKARRVNYIERYSDYCEAARLNFRELGAGNITVSEGDGTALLDTLPAPGVIYIDPARRGAGDKRVFALADCEPDLLQLRGMLLRKAPKVVAKLSPMADIRHTLSLLPGVTEVHVLSVRNECKELILVLEREGAGEPPVRCVDFTAEGAEQAFSFTFAEETAAVAPPANDVLPFLYEPNASVLKAGAFKCVAQRFGVQKLHTSSHLYTSQEEALGFPGRVFAVEEVIPFTGKTAKTLARKVPQANVAVRNFPLSVNELRKRTRIAEGGPVYLFATTLAGGEKVIVQCRKVFPLPL
ncbi:MAG: SAM-dependent methyltransferase [Parabacteroides sp.]|nr:SAM-dependent methyltransferase [Parabacteroides sp.]